MKKILFMGGLGNQLFQYAFYKYVVNNIDVNAEAVLLKGNNHGKFQLLDYFDTEIKLLSGFPLLLFRIKEFLSLKGIVKIQYANEDNFMMSNSNYIADYYQNSKYISPDFVRFKDLELDIKNKNILNTIQNTNSVSVHVRRGDYLMPQYRDIYGNICTTEYYKEAINICRHQIRDIHFYVFSDDIEWTRTNLPIDNAIYIDWNEGEKAPIDMYLMSHCKANIIANSTFSFWGAYLNKNNNLVIYPRKWFNSKYEAPQIFPKDWIGL